VTVVTPPRNRRIASAQWSRYGLPWQTELLISRSFLSSAGPAIDPPFGTEFLLRSSTRRQPIQYTVGSFSTAIQQMEDLQLHEWSTPRRRRSPTQRRSHTMKGWQTGR